MPYGLVIDGHRVPASVADGFLLHAKHSLELLGDEHVLHVRGEEHVDELQGALDIRGARLAVNLAVVGASLGRDVAPLTREYVREHLGLDAVAAELGRDRVRVERVEVVLLLNLAQAAPREAPHQHLVVQKVRLLHRHLHAVGQLHELETQLWELTFALELPSRREGFLLDEPLRDVEHLVLRDLPGVFLALHLVYGARDVLLRGPRPSLHGTNDARVVDVEPLGELFQVGRLDALDAGAGDSRLLLGADDEFAPEEVTDELVPEGGAVGLIALDEELLRVRELLSARDAQLLLAEAVQPGAGDLAQARLEARSRLALLADDLQAEDRRGPGRLLDGARRGEERGIGPAHDLVQPVVQRQLE